MSDIYSVGLSGLRAYQGALGTVSENIANAQTAGYTKRAVSLKEVGATAGGTSGSGVYLASISRTADLYRASDVRRSGADLARTETAAAWLERIGTGLTAPEIGARITSFFNAATTLAADPGAATPREQMLAAADQAAYAFTQAGRTLSALSAELTASADQAVAQLNGLAATLAKVNDGLQRTSDGTSAQALLADQRDQLLEQMSALTDTNVTIDALGRATVKLAGPTGPTLVAPDGIGVVSYTRDSDGAFSFAVARGPTLSALTPGGGALAGLADTAQRISDTRDALGQLASDFATAANDFQAAGRDLDGNPGAPMFAIDADDPTHLTMILADPRKIAAANPGGGTRDNSNLLTLAATRKSANFEGRATGIVGQNATALAAARTVAAAQGAIREGAVARYDATAGVDLDNEAVDLMRYQQAYQACSRVIQVGRECFQSLLSAT
jgi:flagellar hook-associated protein 1 FlgK